MKKRILYRKIILLIAAYLFTVVSLFGKSSVTNIPFDWNNACWIGVSNEDLPFYSHYLPVFKIDFSLQLDEKTKSTRAGFVYGANDERLLDKNKNFYGLENKRDSSYILIELDINMIPATLNIYRTGYSPKDQNNTPLHVIPIPSEIINEKNRYEKHSFFIHSNLGITQIFIDGEKKENLVADILLNPYGKGGDFFAYPVVGDIGFYLPKNQNATISDVKVCNFRAPSNALFERSMLGNTIFNPSHSSMPMLRTEFASTDKKITKAQLYVTARGIYDFYINGKRINNDYFNPGSSQYNKTHFYQTYDVTSYIQSGKNAMGAILGEGWWSGGSTYAGENWNFFGDRQSLLAKLVVTYDDGKEQIIVTNPETWKYFNNGAVISSSFFQGEVYDATKEISDWSKSGYNDNAWKLAKEISLEGTSFPLDYSTCSLMEQPDQSVQAIRELTAVSVKEVRPKVFVYDMGQNFAGVPQISLNGMNPGQKITLRFAEVQYPDLPEYKENTGMIMLENIRAAMAQDIYICKGGNETFSPRFTFHGYRFIEITGIEQALPIADVKSTVLSSVDRLTAHFECSNSKVNRLWENIIWSTYSNFLSVPTDCPQRNERMGWSGDISVFSRTAVYLADMQQFLRRHMLAMRDGQRKDGRFPDVAPMDVGFGGLLWGSAGITVPWEIYQQYGDTALLAEHYDAMKRYIQFVRDNYIDPETNVIVQRRAGLDLGDWLGLEEAKNDRSLLWESYFLYDLEIMQKVATILNKSADAEQFANFYSERKTFFNDTYIDKISGKTISSGYYTTRIKVPEKGKEIDTQTSYVLPLAFNIVDEKYKEKFVNNFIKTIQRENVTDKKETVPPYSLMTGFIGTAWISKALSDNNLNAEAYRLLQQTSYPSWLYPVEQGATTIWERLNSYTHTNGFGGNNNMNSFNHYSFGAVGAWLIEYSLGIRRDENNTGFKYFILAPEVDPTGEMTYAKGYYDSPYGRIESDWKIENGKTIYHFTVPANTTATLYLPVSAKTKNKGVRYEKHENNKAKFLLQAGEYEFEVMKK